MDNELTACLDAMKRFAGLADLVRSEIKTPADWVAVASFVASIEPYLKEVSDEVRSLVTDSEGRLGLGVGTDPFRVDYGMHRWLQDECEPAYSDWLHWLVKTIARNDWIFSLLGVPNNSSVIREAAPVVSAVDRETPVWQQSDGVLIGFLDLDVWFGDSARIVVECKTFDQSFEKQLRYRDNLDVDAVETDFVLLTKDHPDDKVVLAD
jgi:hypothetical protein